jgi:glycosyltransferase involved in cell wall biosynthesis
VIEHLSHVPAAYVDLRRADDDVVVAFDATSGLAAGRWSAATGRPSVLAYMGVPDRPALTGRVGRLEATRRAARDCTGVTALSRAAAAAFERWLGVDARVIPPGVDLDRFSPGGERAERPTIYCPAAVGDPRKGVDLLLEGFALLRREVGEAELLLARPADASLAARLRATPRVELVDTDDESLIAAYRRAWTVALPSFGEAFGLVLVEALACGTPVVGTDDGAIPEIVDRAEIGRLFPRGDAEALAAALRETLDLAGDPATATACRERAGSFASRRTAAAYRELYSGLLG